MRQWRGDGPDLRAAAVNRRPHDRIRPVTEGPSEFHVEIDRLIGNGRVEPELRLQDLLADYVGQ